VTSINNNYQFTSTEERLELCSVLDFMPVKVVCA